MSSVRLLFLTTRHDGLDATECPPFFCHVFGACLRNAAVSCHWVSHFRPHPCLCPRRAASEVFPEEQDDFDHRGDIPGSAAPRLRMRHGARGPKLEGKRAPAFYGRGVPARGAAGQPHHDRLHGRCFPGVRSTGVSDSSGIGSERCISHCVGDRDGIRRRGAPFITG